MDNDRTRFKAALDLFRDRQAYAACAAGLGALPGIQAVHNDYWRDCRRAMGARCWPPRVLRLAGGLPS